MSPLIDRMIRAAKLDVKLYEEVEADKSSMGQAMAVVAISSVAAGFGGASMGIGGLIGITVMALVGWFFWSYLTFLIGTKLLPEPQTKADYGELLRTIGFSSSPGVIRILGIFPALFKLANFVAGVWMLVAMVIAVRQALDYESTPRAVGVCVIGWIIQALLLAVLLSLAGGTV